MSDTKEKMSIFSGRNETLFIAIISIGIGQLLSFIIIQDRNPRD